MYARLVLRDSAPPRAALLPPRLVAHGAGGGRGGETALEAERSPGHQITSASNGCNQQQGKGARVTSGDTDILRNASTGFQDAVYFTTDNLYFAARLLLDLPPGIAPATAADVVAVARMIRERQQRAPEGGFEP